MKTHTLWGANMLMDLSGAVGILARDIALYHHEKFDGTGYWGKRANQLPYYVHIVTICDVYVALISPRPYKRTWASGEALDYIKAHAGKHFSPVLAQLFIKLMQEQNIICDFGSSWPEVRGE
jgi:putative two-component system response regulator